MSIKVKICGLTTQEAVLSAVYNGADYLGFVFFPQSPRFIPYKAASLLCKDVPDSIGKVAVLVDVDVEELKRCVDIFCPAYLQFHGNESREFISQIKERFGIKIIKAFAVRTSDDIAKAMTYSDIADMLLFDAKAPANSILPGGNGVAFDWALLKERHFNIEWFLSGGLNALNVQDAILTTGAKAVDVSSSLESEPGVKDPELIRDFIKVVKTI